MKSKQTTIDRIIDLSISLHRVIKQRMLQIPKGKMAASLPQIFALTVVAEHEGMTMKELAQHLRISSPSTTTFVDRLVRLKWVARASDPRNRRVVRLKLTKTGERMLQKTLKAQHTIVGSVFGRLSVKEQKDLVRILERLVAESSKK